MSKEVYNLDDLEKTNKLYEEHLEAVENSRKEMEEHPDEPDYKIKFKEAILKANFFGSETYFTQGAYFHVVASQQLNITNLPISVDELMDSFIENIGDMLKEIRHYQKEINAHCTDNNVNLCRKDICIEAVGKFSKYLTRALDALHRIQDTKLDFVPKFMIDGKTLIYDKAKITQIFKESNEIRERSKGKRMSIQRKSTVSVKDATIIFENMVNLFSDFGMNVYCRLDDIRSKILIFLKAVIAEQYSNKPQSGGVNSMSYHKYKKYKTKYIQLRDSL